MAKVTDIAWAAGFFDGEGCVMIQRIEQGKSNNPSYSLRISVGQVRLDPLTRFQELFGGIISERPHRGTTIGKVFEWRMGSSDAARALGKLLPYLVLKADQARLGISFQEGLDEYRGSDAYAGLGRGRATTPKEVARREAVFNEMKRLKVA